MSGSSVFGWNQRKRRDILKVFQKWTQTIIITISCSYKIVNLMYTLNPVCHRRTIFNKVNSKTSSIRKFRSFLLPYFLAESFFNVTIRKSLLFDSMFLRNATDLSEKTSNFFSQIHLLFWTRQKGYSNIRQSYLRTVMYEVNVWCFFFQCLQKM